MAFLCDRSNAPFAMSIQVFFADELPCPFDKAGLRGGKWIRKPAYIYDA
jgi:hypothetical protein